MDETKLENINNTICVLKINLNLMGLERYEGEKIMTLSFTDELSLSEKCNMPHRIPLYF